MCPKKSPYGSWKSPITADLIVAGTKEYLELFIENESVYWVESRPEEQGRYAIVKVADSVKEKDFLPRGYSAKTKVYEYGGGSALTKDNVLYFSNFNQNTPSSDQQVYRMEPGKNPVPITFQPNMRYAEGVFCPLLGKLIYIREDHNTLNNGYAVTEIVIVDPNGNEQPQVLVSFPQENSGLSHEHDFYSSISINREGTKIAWLSWNFGNMPWDSNELWIADISQEGKLKKIKRIAGNCTNNHNTSESQTSKTNEETPQSLIQPRWLNDNSLCVISDKDNWWKIYKYSNLDSKIVESVPLGIFPDSISTDVEFGKAQWFLGMSEYAICSDNSIVAAFNNSNFGWKLLLIDLDSPKNNQVLNLKYKGENITEISQVRALNDHTIVCIVGGITTPSLIAKISIASVSSQKDQAVTDMTIAIKDEDVIDASSKIDINSKPEGFENTFKDYISKPIHIEFDVNNTVGENAVSSANGLYYKPENPNYTADDEKPPLLILAHGGPTYAASRNLNWQTQYFTSRGFAVIDINYRGSTGYGRKYRLSLYRNWGLYDRDDCIGVVEHLKKEYNIDDTRVVARGGSAGGYLSLVLATFTNCCKAVASYYGISNLKTLTEDTHKFEAFYPYELIGKLDATVKSYEMRSPINSINLLNCAMIFFQGEDDKVVPPEQTKVMVEELKKKGKPVAELLFEHEAHGFKIAKNIKKALESEYYFSSQILGFKPADSLEPIEIFNWRNL